MEVGRVCIKLRGREAGRKAVIVEAGKDKDFVVIEGPHVRKRKVNPRHLLLTEEKASRGDFAFKGRPPAPKGEAEKKPKQAKQKRKG